MRATDVAPIRVRYEPERNDFSTPEEVPHARTRVEGEVVGRRAVTVFPRDGEEASTPEADDIERP